MRTLLLVRTCTYGSIKKYVNFLLGLWLISALETGFFNYFKKDLCSHSYYVPTASCPALPSNIGEAIKTY